MRGHDGPEQLRHAVAARDRKWGRRYDQARQELVSRGIYEFAPMTDAGASSYKSAVTFKGPVTYTCGNQQTLRATFYRTQPNGG